MQKAFLIGEIQIASNDKHYVLLEVGRRIPLLLQAERPWQPGPNTVLKRNDDICVFHPKQLAGIGPLLATKYAGVVAEAATLNLHALLPNGPREDVAIETAQPRISCSISSMMPCSKLLSAIETVGTARCEYPPLSDQRLHRTRRRLLDDKRVALPAAQRAVNWIP
jgi:hypothetical protein